MEPGSIYSDGLPKVSQLLIENEKVQRKLRKVQQRRDHYAKLYYKTLAELDETKWELSLAKSKIKDLQEKCFRVGGIVVAISITVILYPCVHTDTPNIKEVHCGGHRSVRSDSNTTSPDSGTSLSPAVAPIPPLPANPHAFTLPRAGSNSKALTETHRPVEVVSKPNIGTNEVSHSWRDPPIRPLKLGLPKPNFYRHQQPTFTRSYSLSQGDAIARDPVSILSQDVQTPPFFSRRMSLPYGVIGSRTLSAFQPPNTKQARDQVIHRPHSSHVTLPSHIMTNRRSPSECESRVSMSTASTSQSSCPGEAYYHSLPGGQMLDVLTHIASSQCSIRKLEIANSHLGQPEAMQVFCKDLVKNRSVTSLSLPGNEIGPGSLGVLLDAVQHCPLIKELLLRNNRIGMECVDLIKGFLSQTTLDSLVLTGNEIEQYSHMLSEELPHDFSMEYGGSGDGSVDSGVVREHNQHSDITNSFKYLHI